MYNAQLFEDFATYFSDFCPVQPMLHDAYTYCSFRGRLFNCTCCTKDEAQRLCEDWLVKQDRCYIN